MFVGFALGLRAELGSCACDPADPRAMQVRECSLTMEAHRQPKSVSIFFLKDVSPRKPNRWLALPRLKNGGPKVLDEMTPAERTELWTEAIKKAQELWGDAWGIAYNSVRVRTQCHMHVHIGKLLPHLAQGKFVEVAGPAEIPVPPHRAGLWFHPVGGKLRVHVGEEITETTLLR
jgi:hypothetical protein